MIEDQEFNHIAVNRQKELSVLQHPSCIATERDNFDQGRGTPAEVAPAKTSQMEYYLMGIVKWLSGLFLLTEEDLLNAGISIDGEMSDR